MSRFRRNPDFSPDDFLAQYWQQKPVLLRGFIPEFSDPINAEELAGMACEKEVESRLVSCFDDEGWRLSHGPIAEARFPQLPDHDWTLLVQAVDQWDDDVRKLRQAFDFLPNWRVDDVMVSFAARNGGVGPHFDYYDVFLLQGRGRRRWQLGQFCRPGSATTNQAGLSVVAEFSVAQEFLLAPGDALYVPARLSHRGIVEEPGLCYSIGLRAPALADALEGVSDLLIARASPAERYQDPPGMLPPADGGEIRPQHLRDFQEALQAQLSDPALFQQWFGRAVTRPRYPDAIIAPETPFTVAGLEQALTRTAVLYRHPGSRFAWMQGDAGLALYVDDEYYARPAGELKLVSKLCDLTIDNCYEIWTSLSDKKSRALVLELVNRGSLYLPHS